MADEEATTTATAAVAVGSRRPDEAAPLLLVLPSALDLAVDADEAVVADAAFVVCEMVIFLRAPIDDDDGDVCIDVLLVVGAKLLAPPLVAVVPPDFVVDSDDDDDVDVEESSCWVVLSVAPCTGELCKYYG